MVENVLGYFNDKFQRSKNFNILEKTESSGVEGKLKGRLDLSKSLTSRKKVMIKSVFAKMKQNKAPRVRRLWQVVETVHHSK